MKAAMVSRIAGLCSILLLSLVPGCGDDDGTPTGPGSPLIGTWNMTRATIELAPGVPVTITASDTLGLTVVLREDSTFRSTLIQPTTQVSDSGMWSATDSILTLVGTNGTPQTIPYTVGSDTLNARMTMPLPGVGSVLASISMHKE